MQPGVRLLILFGTYALVEMKSSGKAAARNAAEPSARQGVVPEARQAALETQDSNSPLFRSLQQANARSGRLAARNAGEPSARQARIAARIAWEPNAKQASRAARFVTEPNARQAKASSVSQTSPPNNDDTWELGPGARSYDNPWELGQDARLAKARSLSQTAPPIYENLWDLGQGARSGKLAQARQATPGSQDLSFENELAARFGSGLRARAARGRLLQARNVEANLPEPQYQDLQAKDMKESAIHPFPLWGTPLGRASKRKVRKSKKTKGLRKTARSGDVLEGLGDGGSSEFSGAYGGCSFNHLDSSVEANPGYENTDLNLDARNQRLFSLV